MKVLVTGHRGYVGAVLVPILLEAGHDVSGFDLDYFGQCTYSHGGLYRAVPTIQKDIRDAVPTDFEGFEAVVHLAGLPDIADGVISPELLYEVNHKAGVRVALAASTAGASRFLLASSCAVYGDGGDSPLDESAEPDPHAPFGVSKLMAERDIAALAGPDFSPTFLRLAEPCGLSPRLRLDLPFNAMVARGAIGKDIVVPDGMAWRAIAHVQDIGRVVLAMLAEPRLKLHGEIFNVGSSAGVRRQVELAEAVADTVPGSRIRAPGVSQPDMPSRRISFEKLERALPAVVPQWTPQRSAEQLYEAFQASMLSEEEVNGVRYDRIAELRQLLSQGALNEDLRRGALSSGFGGPAGSSGEGLRVIQ